MRLFIDECPSPNFAIELARRGHDAIHPLHVGRRGQLDHTVKDNCLTEDRVVVTENVGDVKALLGREPLHPGLIALPHMIVAGVSLLEAQGGDAMDTMINHCLDLDAEGRTALHALSAPG